MRQLPKEQCPGPRGGASSDRETEKGWGLTSQGVWEGKERRLGRGEASSPTV